MLRILPSVPGKEKKRRRREAIIRMTEVAGPLTRMRSGYVGGVGGVGKQRREIHALRQWSEERGVVRRDWWISRARGTKHRE